MRFRCRPTPLLHTAVSRPGCRGRRRRTQLRPVPLPQQPSRSRAVPLAWSAAQTGLHCRAGLGCTSEPHLPINCGVPSVRVLDFLARPSPAQVGGRASPPHGARQRTAPRALIRALDAACRVGMSNMHLDSNKQMVLAGAAGLCIGTGLGLWLGSLRRMRMRELAAGHGDAGVYRSWSESSLASLGSTPGPCEWQRLFRQREEGGRGRGPTCQSGLRWPGQAGLERFRHAPHNPPSSFCPQHPCPHLRNPRRRPRAAPRKTSQ